MPLDTREREHGIPVYRVVNVAQRIPHLLFAESGLVHRFHMPLAGPWEAAAPPAPTWCGFTKQPGLLMAR